MKRMCSLIIALVIVLMIIPYAVFSTGAATGGKVGECKWRLSGTVLTISGTGEMGDSLNMGVRPWGKAITEVIIEEGVTNIGGSAFMDCKSLEKVSLPSTLTVIGCAAFYGCTKLGSITIPDGVTEIGTDCFTYCERLKSINIPKSVTSIGLESFDYCYKLKSITVDKQNKMYSSVDGVLFNKDKTELIKYPEARGKHQGDSYTVPETVNKIWFHAFEGAYLIDTFHLPDGLTEIAPAAFYKSGAYWKAVNSGEDIFYISNYLIEVVQKGKGGYDIKDGTRLIAGGAFMGCSKMKRITIPEGVEYIGDSAFWTCSSLKSIYLPLSIKAIDGTAFLGTPLTDVYYGGNEKEKLSVIISSSNKELDVATWYFDSCIGTTVHRWGKTKVENAVSCTEDGVTVTVCNTCKATRTEIISAYGHDLGILSEVKAPTCVSAGVSERLCSICGYSEEQYIEPIGHIFSAWVEESAPTCTTIGVNRRNCTQCDVSEVDVTEPLGHKYGVFIVEKKANVWEEGYKNATCVQCGDVVTEIIPSSDPSVAADLWFGVAIVVGVVAVAAVAVIIVMVVKNKKSKKE